MRTIRDLISWATAKMRSAPSWLALPKFGEEQVFEYPLRPPNEKQALADQAGVARWAGQWANFGAPGVEVEWVQRRWANLGTQRLPGRARVEGASAIAGLAGQSSWWRRLRARASLLRDEFGDAAVPALPSIARRLGDLVDDDVGRVVGCVGWLVANPDSDLLIRQMPVVGVDTKWLERHRGVVDPLVRALAGRGDLGLRKDPRRFRVRLLDDVNLSGSLGGGLRDFSASAAELDASGLRPGKVVVTENMQSMLALGPLPGVVAVHGGGVDVVELSAVRWIADAQVFYWGDLDTHGFRILSMARQQWPQVESVLMDVATLEAAWSMAVPEPKPYRGAIGHLTAAEMAALARLREGDWRLEQERIPWEYAWARLREQLGVR